MSKKEKREKDQEKNIPQQETACEEETEKQPEAETKAGDQGQRQRKPKAARWRSFKRSWAGRRTCY